MSDTDSIGIPILIGSGANRMFVPEMDADFRIVKFQSFYNYEGYDIEYDIPRLFSNKEYSIGDYSPIPFWLNGQLKSVDGDIEPEHLIEQFRQFQNSPLFKDLTRIFKDARSGVFLERQKSWHAQDIEIRFHDVLAETPSHARYWVSRYRLAVASARNETQPPHPIDKRLRAAAGKWIELFASKTDLPRLFSVLGSPKDGVFSSSRIRETLLAFIIHQIAVGNIDKLRRDLREEWLVETYPSGIYYHYLEHGWPNARFSYKRLDDILEPVWNIFIKALENDDYKQAKWLSVVYFGFSDAPKQIEGMLFDKLRSYREALENSRRASRHIFRDRALSTVWQDTAAEMLSLYSAIGDLDYMINGKARKDRHISPWLAIDDGYLKQLKSYARGDD